MWSYLNGKCLLRQTGLVNRSAANGREIGSVHCSSSGRRNKAMLRTKTILDGREGETVMKQASQNGLMKTVRALLQNCHWRSLKAPDDIRGSVLAAAAGRVVGAVNRENRAKRKNRIFPQKASTI